MNNNISYLNNMLHILESIRNYDNYNDEKKNVEDNQNEEEDNGGYQDEEEEEEEITIDYRNNHNRISNMIGMRSTNLLGNIFSHSISHMVTNYVRQSNENLHRMNRIFDIVNDIQDIYHDFNENKNDYIQNIQHIQHIQDIYNFEYIYENKENKEDNNKNNIEMDRIGIILTEEKDTEKYKGQECSICNENYENEIFLTKCAHPFHKECIERWLNEKHNCPICRYHFV